MNETNATFAYRLLFEDPETGEELRPDGSLKNNEDGSYTLTVTSKDGSRKWAHRISTSEAP